MHSRQPAALVQRAHASSGRDGVAEQLRACAAALAEAEGAADRRAAEVTEACELSHAAAASVAAEAEVRPGNARAGRE